MIRKVPYQLNKLPFYYHPSNLPYAGGTIGTAIFETPKLLKYSITLPKGFNTPIEYPNILNPDGGETTIEISQNNSGKDEIIFTGLSSTLYSELKSANSVEARIKAIDTIRFQIIMEQQSIISVVSVLETFVKSVQSDHGKPKRIHHRFSEIMKILNNCGIKKDNLELLNDEKTYSRTKEIIDYAFGLRNLYVHNGGIIDEHFYGKYKNKVDDTKIGLLIRIDYKDYIVIREWLSFFIQEICRIVEGYDDVWKDYLLSTGTVLSDINLKLITDTKDEIVIPLQDGVELKGIYEDEIKHEVEDKTDENARTFNFQLNIGELIEKKMVED